MTSATKFESYFLVLRDVIRAMHSITSLQEVLDIVVTKTTGALEAKGALLRILNKETNQFEVRAACGLGERYLTKGPVSTETLLSTLSELDKVYIITDIWNAPRVEYPQATWDEGIRMMVDMPLGIDEPMGLIRIYFTEKREFSDDELDFIKTIAMHCACVIERVQVMESQRSKFSHLAAQMDKLSSLGRMAAGIAHEINNPLAGILLYSSNLSKKVPPGGFLEDGLKIIVKETQRCKSIIQGLLEFARDKEPQRALVNMNDIMESALGIVENEFHLRHVRVRKQLDKDIETLRFLITKELKQFGNIGILVLFSIEHSFASERELLQVQVCRPYAYDVIKILYKIWNTV
jgi:signal transduction histidine kinase